MLGTEGTLGMLGTLGTLGAEGTLGTVGTGEHWEDLCISYNLLTQHLLGPFAPRTNPIL